MNHTYVGGFSPFSFRFFQSSERFYVEEIPLSPATGRGEHLQLKLRKRDLSTSRVLNILSAATGASEREIGYAGLKDKAATTIQYFTLPHRYEKGLRNLKTERVELLQSQRTRHPLKTGALRGNRFRILLDRIEEREARRLLDVARRMEQLGIPNYFGYQRFGEDGLAWEQGRTIAHSGKRLKGSRERLLVAAWQSRLFNQWLSRRVAASRLIREGSPAEAASALQWPRQLVESLKEQPQFFKLFGGDLLRDEKTRKLFTCKDPLASANAFEKGKAAVTGLLPGDRVWRARGDARHLEAPYDDEELTALPGDRRDAWIRPWEVGGEYDRERSGLWLEFTLPPGAYATTLLEELAQRPLAPKPPRPSRHRK
jgi:tRNA pseudouridine13 synthase